MGTADSARLFTVSRARSSIASMTGTVAVLFILYPDLHGLREARIARSLPRGNYVVTEGTAKLVM